MKAPVIYPHKKFLEDHQDLLTEHPLPEMLQKRLDGFSELEAKLNDTTDLHRSQLEERLETLSHELDEDLEEYFEEFLDNNELDEEMTAAVVAPHEIPEPLQNESDKVRQGPGEAEELQSTPDDPTTDLEEELTDEKVLDSLVKVNETYISISELRKRGFTGHLGARLIKVGRFILYKKRYDFSYVIIEPKDKKNLS